jgi:tetratricopeptide (TPR) repeat protein
MKEYLSLVLRYALEWTISRSAILSSPGLPEGSDRLQPSPRWGEGGKHPPEVPPFPRGDYSGVHLVPLGRAMGAERGSLGGRHAAQSSRHFKYTIWVLLLVYLPPLVLVEPGNLLGLASQESNASKAQEEKPACRMGLELAGSANPADALPYLTSCQQILTKTADAAAEPLRWELAKTFVKLERFTEAASVLETIHDKSQEGTRQKLLGLCYAKSSRVEDAIQSLSRAVSLDSRDAEARFNLGVLLSEKKEVDAALMQLGEAVNLNPAEPRYSLGLAEALLDGKRYSVAVEFLKAVRPKFEALGQFHYTLGLAYYGLHNAPSAIEELEKATALEPQMEAAFYFLGNAYALAEEYEKASGAYRQAIALNPKQASYYGRMALVAEKLGNVEQVMSNLQQVVRLDPEDVISQVNLAKTLSKMGRLPEAIEQLQTAVKKAPDYKEAYYLLSSYSRQIGDIKAADAYIETYRQLASKASSK